MKFWLLTHKLGSWNFSVNPYISSLERDILLWWKREEAAVWEQREKKTKTKKKEKRKRAGLSVWCSQGNEIRRGLLGQPKSDKRRGQLGWDTWKTREEKSHSLFPTFSTFLHSHSNFPTKIISCIHTKTFLLFFAYMYTYIYIHTYIYICIYIYILTSIKLYP